MRHFFVPLLLSLLALRLAAPGQPLVEHYIGKYKGLAVGLMQESGIPASIILSVAIVESGACNSRNCKLLNNHFGIKAGNKKYRIPGTSFFTAYRTYPSDTASYRHFCEIIGKRKFYPGLRYNRDYASWVHKISLSGYARVPVNWRNKVMMVIRKHRLDTLDYHMGFPPPGGGG